ncbi:UNVERIFIED_CONTAM: Formyltetrahydrofolate deformylase 1, mitochondrial [Sesamum radiatum]|uniref:Formyltetrahydrofolate deformylase 1, mitochondrial n=1 Tax=Sesamum radiatum TaxID=300843 RepID=A0AAW2MF55_SESRA
MSLLRRTCARFSPQVHVLAKRSLTSIKLQGKVLMISPPLLSSMAFMSSTALEFVFDPAKWPREQMDDDFSRLSKIFSAMRSVVRVPSLDPKYKIAVLASKQDHCLVDLLHGWQDRRLPVNITAVISNHDRGPNTHVMRFLERHGIPYHHLDITKEGKREEDILNLVKDTDFLVLARYMQILSGNFLRSYGRDIINIHHGLLPSFKGGNPSKQLRWREFPLRSFVQKSENLEKQCLAKAIKSYCELRVLPYEKNKTVVF